MHVMAENKGDVTSCWWEALPVLGAAAVCAPEHLTVSRNALKCRVSARGSAQDASRSCLCSSCIPHPSPGPWCCPVPAWGRWRLCHIHATSSALVAGAAPGQRGLGEQPPAEAPRAPHLPGRADPPRDEDQGNQQRGAPPGPADPPAGEGAWGWGCPGAPLRSGDLHCCRALPKAPGTLCASASPVQWGVCGLLLATTVNWVLWGELGRGKGKGASVAPFSMCLESRSRALLLQVLGLSLHSWCPPSQVPPL